MNYAFVLITIVKDRRALLKKGQCFTFVVNIWSTDDQYLSLFVDLTCEHNGECIFRKHAEGMPRTLWSYQVVFVLNSQAQVYDETEM